MIEIQSSKEFYQTISTGVTVVDFYANWCGPCKAIAPRYEQLSLKYTTVKFLKVNVDNLKDVSQKEGVSAMPTFNVYKNGSKIGNVVGADINKLEQLVQQNAAGGGFGGKGRTLADSSSNSSSSPAAFKPTSLSGDQIVMAIFVVFFVYLYFNK